MAKKVENLAGQKIEWSKDRGIRLEHFYGAAHFLTTKSFDHVFFTITQSGSEEGT